jgi:hypothetical protein
MQIESKNPKLFWLIISAFLLVPLIVSVVSTIHVINFFELSNYRGLAITLAIAFEAGALAALAGLVALDKINKNVVWFIFFLLTLYQMMGNTYYSYDTISNAMVSNPNLIKNWIELFGFSYDPEDLPAAKRIISIISGAVLPIVSLCFLDLSVDYIQKSIGIKLNRPVWKSNEENIAKEDNLIQKNDNNTSEKNIDSDLLDENKEDIKEESSIEAENNKTKEDVVNPFVIENQNNDTELSEIIDDENFERVVLEKKKKLENLKEPYLNLLLLLYKGGEIVPGDTLPSYVEFQNIIPKNQYTESQIKSFLTLCNYLNIFKISGTHKVALKSYGEAINSLNNYLNWN